MIQKITIFVLAAVGSALVAAPKKAETPKVEAKAPAVVASPVPVTAKADGLGFGNAKFSASLWGGLGIIVSKSTHTKEFESFASNSGIEQKATTGAPVFGATVWYGNSANAVGLEGGYSQVYKNTSNTSGVSYTYALQIIQVQALYRYEISDGLYAAAGAGIAIGSITADNTSYVQASLKSKIAPLFSLRIGYDYPLTPQILVGAYVQGSIALLNMEDTFSSGKQTYSAGNVVVAPIVQLTYKF